MKYFALTLTLLLVFSSLYGQSSLLQNNDDNATVNVVAYFCKGDTMKYRYVQGEYKVEKQDTVGNTYYEKEFIIVVTDSTPEGYKMELTPLSFRAGGDSVKQTGKQRMNRIVMENTLGTAVKFSTDENGSILKVDNWRDVRDNYKKGVKHALDSLYAQNAQIDSFMPRKRIEALFELQILNEESIRQSIRETEMLFDFHGMQLKVGNESFVDSTSSVYPAQTNVIITYAKDENYGADGDYAIDVTQHIVVPSEDLAPLAGMVLSTVLTDSLADKTSKIMKDSIEAMAKGDSLTIDTKNSYYIFANGWPSIVQCLKSTDFYGTKKVEYQVIEWTYRSWRGYGLRDEDDNKEL